VTRDEAIEYILRLQDGMSGEFNVSDSENEEDRAKVRGALASLGVFGDEVDPIAKRVFR
jgi:hypothetical protein